MKKNDCRHKSQKKSLLKMWAETKFVVEIDEKYLDQKNQQVATYIIGKARDRKRYFISSTKHLAPPPPDI